MKSKFPDEIKRFGPGDEEGEGEGNGTTEGTGTTATEGAEEGEKA